MKLENQALEISDDKARLNLDAIHTLLKDEYWCKGIPREKVVKAIENSLCFGGFVKHRQVAFARVVTDGSTFAWICDVVVERAFRGQGISKELIEFIMNHPELKGLRRICLATKDAHKLYEKYGFKVTETPQNWMEIKNNNIYLNSAN